MKIHFTTNSVQEYQNNLEYQMRKYLLTFIESEFLSPNSQQEDYWSGERSGLRGALALPLTVSALVGRINVLDSQDDKDIEEGDKLVAKLQPLIEEFEKEICTQAPILLHNAATAYGAIANFHFGIGAEIKCRERLEKGKFHTEKACELFERMGDEVYLRTAKRNLDMIEAFLSGCGDDYAPSFDLDYYRACYNDKIIRRGKDDVHTIKDGVDLAVKLWKSNHGIEAERLLTELASISSRVHGSSHECTQRAVSALNRVQARLVTLKFKDGPSKVPMQAVQYEDDDDGEEWCVLWGPLREDDDGNEMREPGFINVPSEYIVAAEGTPVICHGLRCRSNSHLNGKIGDLKYYDQKSHSKCVIDFEEEGLEPALVNVTNVRILFDLPKKE